MKIATADKLRLDVQSWCPEGLGDDMHHTLFGLDLSRHPQKAGGLCEHNVGLKYLGP